MKKTLATLLLIIIFFVVLAAEVFQFVWSREVLVTSCQPQELKYNSMGPYCVRLIKLSLTLSSRYIILISKETEPNYGFVVNFPTPNIISREEFDRLTVKWLPESVDLETMWNIKVSVPKHNFIGNR